MTLDEFGVEWKAAEPLLRKKARRISYEPDDLVQDTAVALLRYRHTFRDGTKFIAWATTVLVRIHLNSYTRERYTHAHYEISDPSVVAEIPPAKRFVSDSLDPGIGYAMNRLPIKDRVALLLCDYAELSVVEAARELGIGHSTLRARLRSARTLMRLHLGPQFARPNTKKCRRLQ